MSIALRTFCLIDYCLDVALITVVLLIPYSAGWCSKRELEAYTTGSLTYKSPGYSYYKSGSYGGYDNGQYCEVLFKASYDGDGIRLEVTHSDLEPRTFFSGSCEDKVTVYDGSSTANTPVLGEFCGQETPVYESTGSFLYLVFKTNGHNSRNYQGFTLKYSSVDRGGADAYLSSSSVDAGTIVAAVIPAVILYAVLFFVVYRRCKYAQRVRRNLEATGHTPEDLRMAMITMLDQASRGPLNHNQGSHGQSGNSNTALQQAIVANMNSSSRASSTHEQIRRGRVRHPAGDIQHHEAQQLQPPLLHSNHHGVSDDSCSGYGSDREDAQPAATDGITGHIAGNGTAGHHNQAPVIPVFEPDPTGVYYAGSVDEHGVLHPPGGHTHSHSNLSFPVGPSPSVASSGHAHNYLAHHLEDDRHSRGSNRSRRSACTSGRNSPRDGSNGRGSPYRNRVHSASGHHRGSPRPHAYLGMEGQTLTYYGMIDGGVDGGAVSAQGQSLSGTRDSMGGSSQHHEDGPDLSVPPPSYEDAASGKYSPHLTRD